MTKFRTIESLCKIVVIVLSVFPSACATGSQWPHNNFLDIYSHQVGKNINDPSLYTRSEIARRRLPNDDIEIEYLHSKRGNCRVFYRVDSVSHKIVDWRYEGSKDGCAINP